MEAIAIALDIGGTNIKACFRARGSEHLTWLEKIPTSVAFTEKTTNAEAAVAVCTQLQCQLQAIGRSLLHVSKLAISFAGPIDLKTGHVLKAYNTGGERHQGDLAAEFRRHLVSTYSPISGGAPSSQPNVHIMNDALAPALAVVRALHYSHVSDAWAKFRTILPEHARLPVLCLSLGTSVGVSVIQQAPDGEIQIILPETWVSAKIPTRNGDTWLWQALGTGADSLSPDDLKRRLLRDDGALACLLRLYQQEPALGPAPRTVVFIGGRAQSLRGIGMDGTTWQNAEGAEPIVLAVPADVNELAVIGALSYGVSPIEVRVRRVAVIAGLEASGTEIFLNSKASALNSNASAQGDAYAPTSSSMALPPVLAHVMPWFVCDGASAGWHWRMDRGFTFKQDGRVASHVTPLVGPYTSSDRKMVQMQVELMQCCGIRGMIINWYGTQDAKDFKANREAADVLVDECSKAGMLFTVCYEDWTIEHDLQWGLRSPNEVGAQALLRADFEYVRDVYMPRDGFLRAEMDGTKGRPIVLVFGPRRMRGDEWSDMLCSVFPSIESRPMLLKLNKCGEGFDGSFSWFPSGDNPRSLANVQQYLSGYYQRTRGQLSIGSVFPGFHDFYNEGSGGKLKSHGVLPEYDGQTFEVSMEEARENRPSFIQLCTWNDYQEGTVFEPTKEREFYFLLKVQQHLLGATHEAALRDIVGRYMGTGPA